MYDLAQYKLNEQRPLRQHLLFQQKNKKRKICTKVNTQHLCKPLAMLVRQSLRRRRNQTPVSNVLRSRAEILVPSRLRTQRNTGNAFRISFKPGSGWQNENSYLTGQLWYVFNLGTQVGWAQSKTVSAVSQTDLTRVKFFLWRMPRLVGQHSLKSGDVRLGMH